MMEGPSALERQSCWVISEDCCFSKAKGSFSEKADGSVLGGAFTATMALSFVLSW